VGRDSRESSGSIDETFIEGVRSSGANVVDIGQGTTDRTALAASHYGGTGVMVTASHHSWERTGFKLIYEEGNGFSNEDMDRIEELFRERDFEEGEGTLLNEQHEFDEIYIEKLQKVFEEVEGVDGIEGKVLLDSLGGSSRTAPLVFEEVGAEVEEFGWETRPAPEPSESNRKPVMDESEGFDVAVGYDPDGDRVYLVHPELGWVDGDRLFYLLARIVEPDTIAASIDTSPMIEETGAEVEYTRVGDVFVSDRGKEIDADLIGEPNGHYAVPEFSWYHSGILSSMLLASIAEEVPDMLEDVEEYRSVRRSRSYSSREERGEAFEQAKKRVAERFDLVSRRDGIKFEGDGFTGLVRPSGTSPKLRAVVHTEEEEVDSESILDQILD
ncbi:MAG: hypothetical protein SVS85_02925, partial [Candidatus Nanohaloarchaea archaeon]|nr:hypothetical protein [Candidatus Nanohaloarchaea archaeon]